MRTIKFRGKRTDNGEWVYGDLIHNGFSGSKPIRIGIKQDRQLPVKVFSETVGQFTGLFDKDGAKIYEGDKVHSKMSRYLGTEKYYIVEWADCKFVAKGYNGSIEVKPILNFRTDWEVIGNIHDKISDQ